MRPTAFYFFEYLPPGAKKHKVTTYRMTIEDAAQRYPGAKPVLSSKEIRHLPEPGDITGGLGFLATPALGFTGSPVRASVPGPLEDDV